MTAPGQFLLSLDNRHRCDRRRPPGGTRLRRRRFGGRCVLDRVPALVEGPRYEWQVAAERRYLSERSMALLTARNNDHSKEVAKPELMTA